MNEKTGKEVVYKDIVVIIALIILAFFLPTSIQGRQIEAEWGLINAFVIGLIVLINIYKYGIIKSSLFLAVTLLTLLGIASLIVLLNDAGRFSIARLAPAFIVLIVFSLRLKRMRISEQAIITIIDILSLIIIIWNICALLQIEAFTTFIRRNYIQLDDYTATEYSLLVGKPIFTFGVHNFASTFYLFLFYISIKIFFLYKKKRALLYAAIYFIFTLLLKSTAAYGTAAFMIVLVSFELWYKKRSSGKWILVLAAPFLIAIIFINPTVIERLLLADNGFIARYATNSLYMENTFFLQSFPFGAGVTIPDGLYFADSGFWIYLTMGNFPFLIGIFVLFIMFIFSNIEETDDRLFLICSTLLSELSFASFMYWKTIVLLILSVLFLNALRRKSVDAQ